MKKINTNLDIKIILFILLCSIPSLLRSQIIFNQDFGINTDGSNPDTSAALDISSTTKGILVPRMSLAQKDAIESPAFGLLVFVTTDSAFHYYDGQAWQILNVAEPVSGDNLGDHLATQELDLNDNNVNNADTITANVFVGDGSALTNLPGDNLGNHTATQELNLNNNNVNNADTITANVFVGDGTALTNIPGDNLGNHLASQNINLTENNWLSGAGTSSGIQIDSAGRVHIKNTRTMSQGGAAVALKLESGDSPGVYLEQNNSIGYDPHSWRMSANEYNLFIGDVSSGNKLPFRIMTGSQNTRIIIKGDNVGIAQSTSPGADPTLLAALDVNGKIRMQTGAMAGYIPVSDANGIMTWTDPNTAFTKTGNTSYSFFEQEMQSMRKDFGNLIEQIKSLSEQILILQSKLEITKNDPN